jgi:hypothetical protein
MNQSDIELDELGKEFEVNDTWDESAEHVETASKKPLDKVIPVRLHADKWAALRAEARELGVGPSTLARMWIIEKLKERRAGSSQSTIHNST